MAAERVTPHQLLFAGLEDRFAALGDAAGDLATFSRLPDVQRLVDDIESPELLEQHPLAAAEYLHLLFAAWRHWRTGLAMRAVERVPDDLLSSAPSALPREPLYVQLPQRAFWMQPNPDGPHEPLDGAYVVPLPRDELLIVALNGLHSGRSGVTTVALTVLTTDLERASEALPVSAFAPQMEGGAQAGFRSVTTTAELLHLLKVALTVSRA